MATEEIDPARIRILRDLIADAETETPHTADEAMNRSGVVSYLRTKLDEAGRVMVNGD
jgi:hypothetical protein